jgi:hypothetical protein
MTSLWFLILLLAALVQHDAPLATGGVCQSHQPSTHAYNYTIVTNHSCTGKLVLGLAVAAVTFISAKPYAHIDIASPFNHRMSDGCAAQCTMPRRSKQATPATASAVRLQFSNGLLELC